MPTIILLYLLLTAGSPPRPTVAITPPLATNGDESWLGLALADSLTTRLLIHSRYDPKTLERVYPLNVFGWRQALAAARGEGIDVTALDAKSAGALGQQLGADAVFKGSYTVRGKEVTLSWALVGDKKTQAVLPLTLDAIGPAVETLARAVLDAVGQDSKSAGGHKMEPLPLAAYKPFGQALEIVGQQSLDPRAQLVLPEPEIRRALALLSAATDAGPTFVPAWVERGIANAMLGEERAAEDALVQAMAQAGEFDPPTALGLYYLYDRQHKVDEALNVMQEASSTHLGFLQGLGYLGEGYARAGRYHEAVQVLSTFVARVPKSPWAQLRRAAALARLGKHDLAIADTKAVLARFPDSLAILTALASRQIDARQYDAARASLLQVLARKPGLPSALTRLSYLELEQNRPAEALKLAEQAVQALGDGRGESLAGYAQLNLGHALALAGRTTEALAAVAKAQKLGIGAEDLGHLLRDPRLKDFLNDPRCPIRVVH